MKEITKIYEAYRKSEAKNNKLIKALEKISFKIVPISVQNIINKALKE